MSLAIIAHDGKKADLVAFATFNRARRSEFQLVATFYRTGTSSPSWDQRVWKEPSRSIRL